MRRALTTFLIAAAVCQAGSQQVLSSDWEEDDQARTRPVTAPPYTRRASNAYVDPATEAVIGNPDAAEPAGGRPFVSEPAGRLESSPPGHGQAGKPRLEGGVSKYGLNEGRSADRSPYMEVGIGMHSDSLPPFMPVKPIATPPAAFRLWLEKAHKKFALATATMSRDEVVEVKGQWDDSSRTIRALGIPHTSIKPRKIEDYELDKAKVLVVNCAGELPLSALQKVRDFVARGGFLLTTDLALHGTVQRAFPRFIEWNGGLTDRSTVDGTLTDAQAGLTRGLPRRAGWKLDEGSETVRVVRPQAVRVLARSALLARSGQDPDGQGVLAAWFPFGRGQVLHLVGHFDNNSNLAFTNMLPDPAPGVGISLRQAIAANFLVAALKGQELSGHEE